MVEALPFVGPAASLIGAVSGGSDTPSAPNISTYQYPNMDSFANSFQTLINQNIANNPATTYAPNAKANYGTLTNPALSTGYQAAGNTAGADSANLAALDKNNATSLSGAAGNLLTGAGNVMNMGMDPQQLLYNRTLQQLQDQIRVGQSARGITMSPYGASLENQELGNFNIDWNNSQLNRAIAALGAATPASTAAAGLDTNAANIGGQGVAAQVGAGQIPYGTNQTIGTNDQNALVNLINTLTGSNNNNQMSLQDILAYMGGGSGQANAGANLAGSNYQNQLTQAQNAGTGLSSLLGQFGSAAESVFGGSNSWTPSDAQMLSSLFGGS